MSVDGLPRRSEFFTLMPMSNVVVNNAYESDTVGREGSQQPISQNHQDESIKTPATVPVVAVVLAAGLGKRFDAETPKQLLEIDGKAMIAWSLETFDSHTQVTDIVAVVNPTVRESAESALSKCGKLRMVISGGAERSDSTAAALRALADAGIPSEAKILIHDAARPFVSSDAITACIATLDCFDAATLAVQSTDTVLLTEDSGEQQGGHKTIRAVPERTNTFCAQTPQCFRFHTICEAYELAREDPDFHPSDDTRAVVEYLPDVSVAIVAGDESNIKITRPSDVPRAVHIAESRKRAKAKESVHRMLANAFGDASTPL
ncbi:MAG: 2-C-methyl-D-erythritol 4-phosphate cytidylyltransferase [Bifidobacterium sp.]|nr:IspD/TarI family cytidylyltransferase [Bifidobacterium sp.]MCI1635239.1 2-C-methyl-D-erythritol 4-phosphate cytidylyltransferase [Bifidobacterium sp.]